MTRECFKIKRMVGDSLSDGSRVGLNSNGDKKHTTSLALKAKTTTKNSEIRRVGWWLPEVGVGVGETDEGVER